jgi:hypothetical protein
MKVVVNVQKPFGLDMGVDLCRVDVGVPEQNLNRAQVGPSLQEMGGKGVAQGVR